MGVIKWIVCISIAIISTIFLFISGIFVFILGASLSTIAMGVLVVGLISAGLKEYWDNRNSS